MAHWSRICQLMQETPLPGESPRDRAAWRAMAHGVAESRTRLSGLALSTARLSGLALSTARLSGLALSTARVGSFLEV